MKKMHVHDHIITFVEVEDERVLSDIELVQQLIALPEVPEELKALARIVLSNHSQNEINNGSNN